MLIELLFIICHFLFIHRILFFSFFLLYFYLLCFCISYPIISLIFPLSHTQLNYLCSLLSHIIHTSFFCIYSNYLKSFKFFLNIPIKSSSFNINIHELQSASSSYSYSFKSIPSIISPYLLTYFITYSIYIYHFNSITLY